MRQHCRLDANEMAPTRLEDQSTSTLFFSEQRHQIKEIISVFC